MASTAGKQLSDEEVRELNSINNLGLPIPDKFLGVIMESRDPSGPVYRYRTAEEQSAYDTAVAEAEKAHKADQDLAAKVRADADKARMSVGAPPPHPDEKKS